MYLKRALEPIVKKMLTQFPIILVTGPRQVGKTTMLKKVLTDEYQYVTLDDYIERKQLEEEPYLFFKNYDEKVILDEIQYVPSSFSYLKKFGGSESKDGTIRFNRFSIVRHDEECFRISSWKNRDF